MTLEKLVKALVHKRNSHVAICVFFLQSTQPPIGWGKKQRKKDKTGHFSTLVLFTFLFNQTLSLSHGEEDEAPLKIKKLRVSNVK